MFDPGSGHVASVVGRVALGQVLSEYFYFPCQFAFHQLLHNHHQLSSGAGIKAKEWPQYQVDSVSSHEKINKKHTKRQINKFSRLRKKAEF
jgi:hypothetical protein